MKLYHDHFYCFGCGEHGDVITLTGKLLGLSSIDSAKRLAADFNIIVHDDYGNGNQTRSKASSPHKVITYREQENRAYRLLSDYCKYLEDCQTRYAPHFPEENPNPLFVTALCELGSSDTIGIYSYTGILRREKRLLNSRQIYSIKYLESTLTT